MTRHERQKYDWKVDSIAGQARYILFVKRQRSCLNSECRKLPFLAKRDWIEPSSDFKGNSLCRSYCSAHYFLVYKYCTTSYSRVWLSSDDCFTEFSYQLLSTLIDIAYVTAHFCFK